MTSDPFSDILRLANAYSVTSGGFTAGGSWAIRFPAPGKIKFFGIVKGSCWLNIDGREAPIYVEEGDVLLLAAQRSYVLAGDLKCIPVEASTIFIPNSGAIVQVGGGKDFMMIGGHVQIDLISGALLADVLPPLIHVRAISPQSAILQWLLKQLVHERSEDQPGASIASAQLAQLMFVQILRAYLNESGSISVGWLKALGDDRIAPALRLIHSEPGRRWKLGELANSVCMSRTTFILRFKAATGVAPLTYLINWRMRLAEHALREETTPIYDIAFSLGYTSDSAFSNAFKRVIGMAPYRYRAVHQASSSP